MKAKSISNKIILLITFSLLFLGILIAVITRFMVNSTYDRVNDLWLGIYNQMDNVVVTYRTFGISDETQSRINVFLDKIPKDVRNENNVIIVDDKGSIIYKANESHIPENNQKLNIAWNRYNAVTQDENTKNNKWFSVDRISSFPDENECVQVGDLKFSTDISDVLYAYSTIDHDIDAYISVYPIEKMNTTDYIFWIRNTETDHIVEEGLRDETTIALFNALYPCSMIMILLYWLLLPVWVFLDARRRQTQPLPWALLVLLTNVVGLIVYWIVQTQNGRAAPAPACPACGKAVKKGYPYCPWCAAPLVKACRECGKTLEPGWKACPWCGKPVD
jgi:RNA polymerase subunit RPABC4/transcription elongation factor Spt4